MSEEIFHLERQSQASWARRFLRGGLLYIVLPYLFVLAIFTLSQRRLIYQPTRVSSLAAATHGLSPSEAKDVTITTDDGLTLHGWLLFTNRTVDSALRSDQEWSSERLLIYFPGNAQHRGFRLADFREFTRHGFDVLIFDYRGYGDNAGSPSQATMQADSRAVWQFTQDELEVDPSRTVIYGESMGGAVAIHLAAALCEESTPPAALITNATFASLTGTVRWHYPWFPFQYLLWDHWPSVERASRLTCPVLMFHGAKDQIVPLAQGRELFAAIPEKLADGYEKRFVELPSNGHNDIPVHSLYEEVQTLLHQVFPDEPAVE